MITMLSNTIALTENELESFKVE